MGAIALLIFAIAISLVQISCSKSNAQQNRPLDNPQLNKIVYVKNWGTSPQIWVANYDGSSATQIPLVLPANLVIDINVSTRSLKISPDGQTIFFAVSDTSSATINTQIYSCSITGSNVSLVIPSSGSDYPILCEAY